MYKAKSAQSITRRGEGLINKRPYVFIVLLSHHVTYPRAHTCTDKHWEVLFDECPWEGGGSQTGSQKEPNLTMFSEKDKKEISQLDCSL